MSDAENRQRWVWTRTPNAKATKQKPKREYTKLIVDAVMATYYWGVVLGSYVVIRILFDHPEYAVEALVALFTYIGAPTAAAIGFYAWKARAENQIKLKLQYGQLAEVKDQL